MPQYNMPMSLEFINYNDNRRTCRFEYACPKPVHYYDLTGATPWPAQPPEVDLPDPDITVSTLTGRDRHEITLCPHGRRPFPGLPDGHLGHSAGVSRVSPGDERQGVHLDREHRRQLPGDRALRPGAPMYDCAPMASMTARRPPSIHVTSSDRRLNIHGGVAYPLSSLVRGFRRPIWLTWNRAPPNPVGDSRYLALLQGLYESILITDLQGRILDAPIHGRRNCSWFEPRNCASGRSGI